ncbi:O-fucosyltransferase family protein [Actinidia rufa]|uniref:O-fucosyltransferase family protein n=1 Tax=Actinidia rufa TaxID=165716 RepID=A0A7J0FR23_9ERIC|nr:O-fucosyltransferase family protein [Actinidia rufa]
MGVAKAWRLSSGVVSKLASVHQENKQHLGWRLWLVSSPSQRRPVSWSVVCGFLLFALGLISLFTGHVISDLEWYSQTQKAGEADFHGLKLNFLSSLIFPELELDSLNVV